MQYRESLPLEDHEVVLTFDDGPLPPRTNHVLDTLACECVKATFFLVGKMATTYPDVVRKIVAAGHTVGTHSQTHPLRLHKVPLAKAEQEISDGIASVTAVLGEPPAPFFRIPPLDLQSMAAPPSAPRATPRPRKAIWACSASQSSTRHVVASIRCLRFG
jgi:peptidoglycan/xylan/chitin deacetylase (PgdA/CDA1 family)